MSNFCQQGDITKIFIVDTGNSGTTTVDVYVTGGTYSNGTLYLTRNDGVTIPVPGFLFTGNTSASCIGNLYISNLYACNVPQESGGGGDPDDPFPPPSPVVITPPPIILVWDPIKSFSPISATTFFGDGSKLTGIPDFYVTGGTINTTTGVLTLNRQNGFVEVTGFTFTGGGGLSADTFVTGYTFTNGNILTIFQNNGKDPLPVIIDNLFLTGLTVNGSISASTYLNLPQFVTGGTFSAGTLTLNTNYGNPINITGITSTNVTTGISADTFVTGFTFTSKNTLTIFQNQGRDPLSVTINNLTLTGLTVSGSLSASTYLGLPISSDNFVTGGTFSNNILTLNRQNGSVTVTGFTDTFVTGFTFSSNTLTISQNRGQAPLTASITTIDLSNIFSAVTFNIGTTGSISASTFYGSGVNLTDVPDNFVTGGTYSNGILTLNRQNGSVTISGLLSADTYVTGFTFNTGTYDLTIFQNNGIAPLTQNLGILAGDITVTGGTYNPNNGVATFYNNIGGSFQVSGFLTGFTDIYLSSGSYNPNTGNLTLTRTDNVSITVTGFTDYFVTGGTYSNGSLTLNRQNGSVTILGFLTGTTTDTFVTGFTYNGTNQLTISQNQGQPNLNVIIDNLSLTGLTVNGSISATTYFGNGQYLTGTPDNYVTGGTYSSGTGTLTLNRQNGSVTISGFSAGGGSLSADTYVTGFTYNGTNQLTISQNGSQPNLSVTINNLTLTGLTVNGSVSATTYFGNGQFLTGIASTDNFVTGGTYTSSTGTLTLNRQNGSVTVTGFTDTFVTGGTFNTSNRVLTLNRQNGSFNISGITDTFVTGFTYSNNNLTINQSQGQSPLTVNISTMTGLTISGDLSTTNLTVTSTSNLNGTINSTNLAGTGDRIVQVSSGGTFSATNQILTAYLVSGSTNANILETTSNWDINGVFIGSGITGTYQGQKFYNNNYFFEAVDNNLWIRLIRG